MLIVPLAGDKIETKDGVEFTVLAYTNYKERGPAVQVEHTAAVPSDAVYFFDIIKINGISVTLGSGKVFKAAGNVKRKYHLPQPGDLITVRSGNAPADQQVSGLKLHNKTEGLTKGLLVTTKGEGENVNFRLGNIVDIQRSIGNDMFDRNKFLRYYRDYTGYTPKK
jgi:hypothetical protein